MARVVRPVSAATSLMRSRRGVSDVGTVMVFASYHNLDVNVKVTSAAAQAPLEEGSEPLLVLGRMEGDRLGVLRPVDDPRVDGAARRANGVGELRGIQDRQPLIRRAMRDPD